MRIGYARVSTGEQKLDAQLHALREAGCEKVYTDEQQSAVGPRPNLEACLDFLREGDTLVVWRLDRFGRSLKDLVEKMDALQSEGVAFVSLGEPIDTTSATGRLVFHLFAALAEFERELGRERTMAGLRAARAQGRTGGRPPALDEEDIPQVQALMRSDDIAVRQICERFDISKATLYRYVGPGGERRQ